MKTAITLTKTYNNGTTYMTIESFGNEAAVKAEKDAIDAKYIPQLGGVWTEEIRPDYFAN